jgi:hypothetical protein
MMLRMEEQPLQGQGIKGLSTKVTIKRKHFRRGTLQ